MDGRGTTVGELIEALTRYPAEALVVLADEALEPVYMTTLEPKPRDVAPEQAVEAWLA